MLKIKRLYSFIVSTFLPVFMMTFVICLFIVLMQFLWRYIEDLVGKGLDNLVLAELFFYAALSLISLALPLAILLASLMAFGNMGERLELLAVKAAGVSLLRAMKPLIVLIGCISIGAFFFQNEAMPRINVKLRSLLISVKQKSPELDIPEGAFYSGINNYSLYVQKKNTETKLLEDLMIYDISEGFDNMSVFVCDSGRMRVSDNKQFLVLNLFSGQRFSNFRESGMDRRSSDEFVPYGRENFKSKEIIIPFNSDFNRMDESRLDGTQIAKDIKSLSHSIDSMKRDLDTMNVKDRKVIGQQSYLSYRNTDSYKNEKEEITTKAVLTKINFDSLLTTFQEDKLLTYYNNASSEAENVKSTYMFQSQDKQDMQRRIRLHKVEWHRKFTLSFACLVFFFIGAPLGAIIRKGGMGMPVVISVLLFIVYYIIDNIGYKMARDGVWEVWQGVWLSSFVLFPLGVFLTYKAMNDSALFNTEAYGKFIRRLLRIEGTMADENTQINLTFVPRLSDIKHNLDLEKLQQIPTDKLRDMVQNQSQYSIDYQTTITMLSILKDRGDNLEDIRIEVKDYKLADHVRMLFNKNSIITNLSYAALMIFNILDRITSSDIIYWLSIVSIILYLAFYTKAMLYYSDFKKNLKETSSNKERAILIIGITCYPIIHFYLRAKMKKGVDQK